MLQHKATEHVPAGGRPGSGNRLCLDVLSTALPAMEGEWEWGTAGWEEANGNASAEACLKKAKPSKWRAEQQRESQGGHGLAS